MDYGVFGSSRLEDEDRQEDLGIHSLECVLEPFVKLSIVICSSAQYTHVLVLICVFMNSISK